MGRPARATGGRRGLRTLHAAVRLLLVCALVILLALIAVREVQQLTAAVHGPGVTSTPTPAPSPAAALALASGGRA